MPNDYNVVYLANPAGINASVLDEHIADNELARGTQNVMPDFNGGRNLVKRYGIREYGTSTESIGYIRSLYYGRNSYYTDQSTNLLIRQIASGVVYSTIASAASRKPVWATMGDYDIMVADSNIAVKTASPFTSFTALANIPTGAYLIEKYNRYLFCAGHSKGSLRWSAIQDPETWDATNELLFDETIFAIKRHKDNLLVFFGDSFAVVYGTGPTFQVVEKNTYIGASAQDVIDTPFGVFFWSGCNGLAWIKDSYQNIDLVMLRKYPELCNPNITFITDISLIYVLGMKCIRVWCYNDVADTGFRIDYYPEKDALYYHTGKGCGMLSALNYLNSYVLTGGKPSIGTNKVYYEVDPSLYAAQADDGATITSVIVTKRMATGSPAIKKTVNSVFPEIELSTVTTISGSVTYKAFADNNSGASVTRSEIVTPGVSGIIENRYGLNMQCRKVQHVLTDNIVGAYVYYNQLTESGTLDKQL